MRAAFGAGRWAMAAVVAAATAVPGWAQTTDRPTAAMDDRWHFNVAPYFWMPAVQGDVGVANLPPVSVDASFSDIFENFDGGLLARFDARRNRFGFGADFVWMNLGAPAVDTELVDLSVDFRQFLAEGIGFYRVASGGRADNPAHLDVLAGVRYFTSRTRLKGETRERRDVRHVLPGPRLGGRPRRRQVPRAARLEARDPGKDRHRRLRLEPDLEPRGRPGVPGLAALDDREPAGATWTWTTTRARASSAGSSTSPTAALASGSRTPGSRARPVETDAES